MNSSRKLSHKKKNLSSFDLKKAFKHLGIQKLLPWTLPVQPQNPIRFLTEHLIRLHRFDLRSTEKSKELLIDAILQEGIQKFDRLKIWKGAYIQSDHLCGSPDYLLADDREYLETPFLSIIEAKRDDFEQGLSQCLPAMQVCSWINRHHSPVVDTYGIVTNRVGWQFYKLTTGGDVYEPRFMP